MVMWQHFKLSSVESIQTRTSRNQAVHPLNTSNVTLRGQIVQSLEHILSTVALSVLLKTFIRYIHYGLGLVTCSVHARPCPFERRESFASKRNVLLIGRQRLCLQQLPTLLLPENGLDRFQEVLLGVWRTASWTKKKSTETSPESCLLLMAMYLVVIPTRTCSKAEMISLAALQIQTWREWSHTPPFRPSLRGKRRKAICIYFLVIPVMNSSLFTRPLGTCHWVI